MKQEYSKLIEEQFKSCVMNTISRVTNDATHSPFHVALLSETVIYWSSFERSFSTSFGQKTLEELSGIAAISCGASEAQKQHETTVELDEAQVRLLSHLC